MSWLPCMHFSNWIKVLVHKFLKWFVAFLEEKLLTTSVCKYALRNNLTSDFYFWFLCLVFVLNVPNILKIVHVFCKFRNLNLSTNSKQWAYLLLKWVNVVVKVSHHCPNKSMAQFQTSLLLKMKVTNGNRCSSTLEHLYCWEEGCWWCIIIIHGFWSCPNWLPYPPWLMDMSISTKCLLLEWHVYLLPS